MKREIPSGGPWITKHELNYVSDACLNGWYQNWHNYLDRFEEAIANYTNTKYAIATSSCTGALHLSMAALSIERGDEVIVPETTWVSTAMCVCYVGAKPVFVDVEKDTWCIDPDKFKSAITPRTKAVIPVHMYGHPAEMDSISKIAKEHGISVIEDAAPGIGSLYFQRPVGSLGDAATFSFQGAKPLVTGEGGAFVTNDKKIYDKAYYYWDHCRDNSKPLYVTGVGFKYKMSNIQAALGLAQLERAKEIIDKRRKIFYWYHDRLKDIPGLLMNTERSGIRNNYYVPTIILDNDFEFSRDEVMEKMDNEGVRNRPFFRCISKLPMFQPAYTPVADFLAERGINLPCATKLSEDDVDYASRVIQKILES